VEEAFGHEVSVKDNNGLKIHLNKEVHEQFLLIMKNKTRVAITDEELVGSQEFHSL